MNAGKTKSNKKIAVRFLLTRFLVEGWALHWEMLLWDIGFHDDPKDKVGALFWCGNGFGFLEGFFKTKVSMKNHDSTEFAKTGSGQPRQARDTLTNVQEEEKTLKHVSLKPSVAQAEPPLRADYLLAQVRDGRDDGGRVHRFPAQARGPRAPKRHRGGAVPCQQQQQQQQQQSDFVTRLVSSDYYYY